MKYKIVFDKDVFFDEIAKHTILPGNEYKFTNKDYEKISNTINDILTYYEKNFEPKHTAGSSSKPGTVNVEFEFSGRMQHNEGYIDGMFSKRDPDEGLGDDDPNTVISIEELSRRAEATRNLLFGDHTVPKKQIDPAELVKHNYVLTRFMKIYFEAEIDKRDEKLKTKRTLAEYISEIEDRIKSLEAQIPGFETNTFDECVNDLTELYKENCESCVDPMGDFGKGRIRLFWPYICLNAKIQSAISGIDEVTVRQLFFEQALAHELFHYFHSCNVTKKFYNPDISGSLIIECLAEYFSINYMYNKYNNYLSIISNGHPDDFEDCGGYDGAAILICNGLWKKNLDEKYPQFYEFLFNSVDNESSAIEACNKLIELRADPECFSF